MHPALNVSSKEACRFCDLGAYETPILSSAAGIVVPSVGSMVAGWELVFPTSHVSSLAELNEDAWLGFSRLLSSARGDLERKFGPTILFEHGSAGFGRTAACGVDHAHMHVVPMSLDLRGAVRNVAATVGSFEWRGVQERVLSRENQDYIYLEDHSGKWVTYADNLPSQVVRRAIAHQLGLAGWDWKTNPRLSVMERTRQKLGEI